MPFGRVLIWLLLLLVRDAAGLMQLVKMVSGTGGSAGSVHTFTITTHNAAGASCTIGTISTPGAGQVRVKGKVCGFSPADTVSITIECSGCATDDDWQLAEVLFVDSATYVTWHTALGDACAVGPTQAEVCVWYRIAPTPSPPTLPPPTAVPPTAVPTTLSPPTPAPQTSAPLTPSPPTLSPPTSAPTTLAPPTKVPLTSSPTTLSPPTPAPQTPSPPTLPPDTLVPLTPSPPTFSPETLAPLTSSPATLAPPTPAPATPPPPTVSPLTSPPATLSPPTPAPQTPSPPTFPPETLAPSTPSPPTASPPTSSPATLIPLTPAPPTASPETPAPPTFSPETLTPPTPSPPTFSPETLAPLTPSPATLAPPTLAPTTPSPPTVSPLTSIPLTSPPATLIPPTPAPSTVSPATSAPSTALPLTSLPATLAPPLPTSSSPATLPETLPPTLPPLTFAPVASTDLPASPTTPPGLSSAPTQPQTPTDTPKTASPVVSLSPVVARSLAPSVTMMTPDSTEAPELEANDTANDITTRGAAVRTVTTLGAVSLASAGSAALAARLLASTEECKIYGDKKHYPIALHPTQISIHGSEAAGMVVGNLGGFVAITTLHLFSCELVRLLQAAALKLVFTSRTEPFVHDVQGLLRFPGGPALLFQVLYQGSSVGALQLLYSAPTLWLRVLGGVATGLCIAVPFFVLRAFVVDAPLKALVMVDSQTAGRGQTARRVLHFLIGKGEWVSVSERNHWSLRYSAVIRPYKEKCLWFYFVQLASMFAISAIQAFAPTNYVACGHIKVASLGVILIMLSVVIKVRPYARSRDMVIDVMVMSFQCFALIFMAVGYYRENPRSGVFDGATVLMVLGVVCILVKVAMDGVYELYVLIVCRRDRLQDRYFDSLAADADVQLLEDGFRIEVDADISTEGDDSDGEPSGASPPRQASHHSITPTPAYLAAPERDDGSHHSTPFSLPLSPLLSEGNHSALTGLSPSSSPIPGTTPQRKRRSNSFVRPPMHSTAAPLRRSASSTFERGGTPTPRPGLVEGLSRASSVSSTAEGGYDEELCTAHTVRRRTLSPQLSLSLSLSASKVCEGIRPLGSTPPPGLDGGVGSISGRSFQELLGSSGSAGRGRRKSLVKAASMSSVGMSQTQPRPMVRRVSVAGGGPLSQVLALR